MITIDLSEHLNPARIGAIAHATERAKREGAAMRVYVGPPDAPQVLTPSRFNVWYVRRADEQAPERAQLFQEIAP